MRRLMSGLALGALVVGALPATAAAQATPQQRYTIMVVGGQTQYDESSALKHTQYGGVEGVYQMTRHVGLGGYLLASRPTTDATFFPLVRLAFSDTVLHFLPSQQVLHLDFGLTAVAMVPLMRGVQFQANGGVGRYVFRLDPERADRPVVPGQEVRGFEGLQYTAAAGLNISLGPSGGMRLQVRDFIFTGFDRELLSLAEPWLGPETIPHPRPDPPAAKSTVHNLRFEIALSFVPGTR